MYVPHHFAVPDLDEVRAMVRSVSVGQLVTVGPDGAPDATLLPILWEGDEVIAHVARANEQWRRITDGTPALVVVTGPDAYVTPRWYASKREHGRVVPTWNYSAVHLSGPVAVHDDVEWLRTAVTRLTNRHEGVAAESERWHVTDAPPRFVDGQLRAIVGISVEVARVEAKAKLSQNRSAEDQAGVVDGLLERGDANSEAVAEAMRASGRGH
jgi:transcriptional regulator